MESSGRTDIPIVSINIIVVLTKRLLGVPST